MAYSILNWAFHDLESYAYNRLDDMSPDLLKKYGDYYQQSLGLENKRPLEIGAAYTESRAESLTIAGITAAAPPVPDPLTPVLTEVQEVIKKIGLKYHPDELVDYLKEKKAEAITIIREQQTTDSSDVIEPQAKSALIEAQKKHLETFEKEMTDVITMVHGAAAKERSRIAVLGTLRDGGSSPRMRELMEQVVKEKAQQQQQARVTMTGSPPTTPDRQASLSNVFIKDLIKASQDNEEKSTKSSLFSRLRSTPYARLETALGTPIQVKENPDHSYTFSIEMPGQSWRPGYHHSPNDNPSREFKTLAELLRASGSETAVVDVNCANEKMALNLARKAFAACRESGFEEKDITVKINGKVFKSCDAGKDEPNLFEGAAAQRKVAIDARADAAKGGWDPTASQGTGLKAEMAKIRAPAAPTEAPTEAPTAAPTATATGGPNG